VRSLKIHERIMLGGSAVLMAASFALVVITSDWWVQLESLEVQDTRPMQDAQIVYKREFFREFAADWSVSIYVMERGQWEAYDSCGGYWATYKPGRPNPYKTLAWLVGNDPDCYAFPKGTYYAVVTLTIAPGSLLSRTVTLSSNVFEVGDV